MRAEQTSLLDSYRSAFLAREHTSNPFERFLQNNNKLSTVQQNPFLYEDKCIVLNIPPLLLLRLDAGRAGRGRCLVHAAANRCAMRLLYGWALSLAAHDGIWHWQFKVMHSHWLSAKALCPNVEDSARASASRAAERLVHRLRRLEVGD